MAVITWRCECGYTNNQNTERMEEKGGYTKLEGNLVRLLPVWVERLEGLPVRGRTYCENCYEPHDFSCLFGAICRNMS